MTSAKEHKKILGDGQVDISRTAVLVSAGDEVTFNFKESDDDTVANIYYGYGREVFHLHIAPDNELTVTKINGVTQTAPFAIGTAGANFKEGIPFRSITLRAATAVTTVTVLGY